MAHASVEIKFNKTKVYGAKWGGMLGSETYATKYSMREDSVPTNRKIGIKNETTNLKKNIREKADKYCEAHGTLVTDMMKEISELANQMVSGQAVSRGKLQDHQSGYELKAFELSETLRQDLIQGQISKSDIAQKVAQNGFIMLGFHYYQLNTLIDKVFKPFSEGMTQPEKVPYDHPFMDASRADLGNSLYAEMSGWKETQQLKDENAALKRQVAELQQQLAGK